MAALSLDITDDPEAMTARELATMLGLTVKSAYNRAEVLVAAGKAVETRKRVTHPAGGRRFAKAYRLVDSLKRGKTWKPTARS